MSKQVLVCICAYILTWYISTAIICPNLEDPPNGIVIVSGNKPGDTAMYICDVGFTPDGEDMRTCGDDGQWSGSEPMCVGKFTQHIGLMQCMLLHQ